MRLIFLYATLASFCLSWSFAQPAQTEGLGAVNEADYRAFLGKKIDVHVGIKLDQITFVDQQSENFGVVGTLFLRMKLPTLAFDVEENGAPDRRFSGEEFAAFARKNNAPLPAFIIRNQQARRFSQRDLVILAPDGSVRYVERFTATLQAPYFNFTKYPFDKQQFFVEVSSICL